MSQASNPTNAKIIAKLDEIIRELSEIRREQQRLSADVKELTKTG